MRGGRARLNMPFRAQEPPAWLSNIENAYGDPPWPPEFGVYFELLFVCNCGGEWIDLHDCNCNDRCPRCNRETEPSQTRERNAMTGAYL